MNPFISELEKSYETLNALMTGPFTIKELADFVSAITETINNFYPDATHDEVEAHLKEAWGWADGKWAVVEKLDEMIKLNILLEPFDGPAIKLLMGEVLLPLLANMIKPQK